jgi:hypothetical protein
MDLVCMMMFVVYVMEMALLVEVVLTQRHVTTIQLLLLIMVHVYKMIYVVFVEVITLHAEVVQTHQLVIMILQLL